MDIILQVGDILLDRVTGEIGLLTRRWLILPEQSEPLPNEYDLVNLWAWDIYWTGGGDKDNKRCIPYTEGGLYNMIRAGTFELLKRVDK